MTWVRFSNDEWMYNTWLGLDSAMKNECIILDLNECINTWLGLDSANQANKKDNISAQRSNSNTIFHTQQC